MLEIIEQPWPWYLAGPILGAIMLVLLFFGESFGISSNLSTFCSMCGAGKYVDFFRFDWKEQIWNFVLIIGVILGGFVTNHFLMDSNHIDLSEKTSQSLQEIGFSTMGKQYVPPEIFSYEALSSWQGLLYLIIGGILVGFGTRYAGGCTSGHAISGLSNLQLPSLIAVIGFFIGGLISTFFIIPLFF